MGLHLATRSLKVTLYPSFNLSEDLVCIGYHDVVPAVYGVLLRDREVQEQTHHEEGIH